MLKFLIYNLKFPTKTMHPNNFTLKAFALKFDGYFINILCRNGYKMSAADADIYIKMEKI